MEIKNFLTEKAVYISIATLGILSSITTLFIDTEGEISIKWLLLVVWGSCTVLIVLIRLITYLLFYNEKNIGIRIIKVIENDHIYILQSELDLPVNTLLSVYKNIDGYEKLCGICLIENIQENKLIAAKLIKGKEEIFSAERKNMVFKTSLPISVFEGFNNEQNI
jgi:cell shape-determining protein MreC